MQIKDIDTFPILNFLDMHEPQWCFMFEDVERSIYKSMPHCVNKKLVLAKMRNLIKKGYVDGCACGCRGDFVITEKGKQHLKDLRKERLHE